MSFREYALLSRLLLPWYEKTHRKLPWRAKPGRRADPYHVWLSEIMLQQTTVATVGPYYQAFVKRWPGVSDLAAADLDEVLHLWQGLGYYARARNLYKCAQAVRDRFGGRFPESEQELLQLPGIGPYTAAAITAIAFQIPAAPVDGNIERVFARITADSTPLPALKKNVKEAMGQAVPEQRPGDFAQGLMDLGATICTPRNPACGLCPYMEICEGRRSGIADELPVKAPKKKKPRRRAVVFWMENERGEVFLRRRPEEGMLGGMMEFPATPWSAGGDDPAAPPPVKADWRRLAGSVRHTFTHFHLELEVCCARIPAAEAKKIEGVWRAPDRLSTLALPTLMKKVAHHVLGGGGQGT